MVVTNQHERRTLLLRLVASHEHKRGCAMKKTIVKTKLVLRKETTRVLRDNDLRCVGAGKNGNDGTKRDETCVAPVIPERD